jgi:glutamyl-tRNA synthetase
LSQADPGGPSRQSTRPRVRFAPSPTGYFHVGSARTALFNWMFARRHGGTFILRIEDTDEARNRPDWIQGIYNEMKWLGLNYDEGPYLQSARTDRHRQVVSQFLSEGRAYVCDCDRPAIDARAKERGRPGYDGHCRDRGLTIGPGKVVRFRVPEVAEVRVADEIRGEVVFPRDAIEDFVIARADLSALFVLANCVDDLDLEITHVIRGEDLLPSTPKAVLCWEALSSAPPPKYAHLPLLVNEKRHKLSKRRDPVRLESYREQGYLPEALINYLALLGWSPRQGGEIQPIADLIEQFDLADVNHSPAFFDTVKLAHVNASYLRALSPAAFAEAVQPFLRAPLRPADAAEALAPLVQERSSTLAEAASYLRFLDDGPFEIDPASLAKAVTKDQSASEVVAQARAIMAELADWTPLDLRGVLDEVARVQQLPLRRIQAPIRVLTTGSTVGLPLFESLALLGKERTVARLEPES